MSQRVTISYKNTYLYIYILYNPTSRSCSAIESSIAGSPSHPYDSVERDETTIGPLIIESTGAEKRVCTEVLKALADLFLVQTKF